MRELQQMSPLRAAAPSKRQPGRCATLPGRYATLPGRPTVQPPPPGANAAEAARAGTAMGGPRANQWGNQGERSSRGGWGEEGGLPVSWRRLLSCARW